MAISEKGHDVPVHQASNAAEQVDSSIEVSIEDKPTASENKSQNPYLVSRKPIHNSWSSD